MADLIFPILFALGTLLAVFLLNLTLDRS